MNCHRPRVVLTLLTFTSTLGLFVVALSLLQYIGASSTLLFGIPSHPQYVVLAHDRAAQCRCISCTCPLYNLSTCTSDIALRSCFILGPLMSAPETSRSAALGPVSHFALLHPSTEENCIPCIRSGVMYPVVTSRTARPPPREGKLPSWYRAFEIRSKHNPSSH